jgi:hypothetical protein
MPVHRSQFSVLGSPFKVHSTSHWSHVSHQSHLSGYPALAIREVQSQNSQPRTVNPQPF